MDAGRTEGGRGQARVDAGRPVALPRRDGFVFDPKMVRSVSSGRIAASPSWASPRPAGELLEMIQSLRVSAPSSSATVITVPLLDACNVYKVFWIVKTQFLIRIKFSDLYNILLIKILNLSEIVLREFGLFWWNNGCRSYSSRP